MRAVRNFIIDTNNGPQTMYYAYFDVSGVVGSPLNLDPEPPVEEIMTGLYAANSEKEKKEFVEIVRKTDPLFRLDGHHLASTQGGIMALAQGRETDLDAKKNMFGLSKFADAVIQSGQVEYPQLESKQLTHLIDAMGLELELIEYVEDLDGIDYYWGLMSFLGDCIAYPAYQKDVFDAESNLGRDSQVDRIKERRIIASAHLITKVSLATGALYAAGLAEDKLALPVSEVLDNPIRI